MDNTKFIIDTLKIERALTGLAEWQKHVQKGSDIDRDISVAVEVLKAQINTDVPDTNVGDMISRQAAIDEAEEWIGAVYCDREEQRERSAIKKVIQGIKALPSAQPDIIRCKDCKWHEGRYRCLNFDVFGFDYNDYCSLAERRQNDTD